MDRQAQLWGVGKGRNKAHTVKKIVAAARMATVMITMITIIKMMMMMMVRMTTPCYHLFQGTRPFAYYHIGWHRRAACEGGLTDYIIIFGTSLGVFLGD